MKKDKQKKNIILWLVYLILGGFLIKLFKFVAKNKDEVKGNFSDFIKDEKEEIKELKQGQESIGKYCHDSFSIFNDYFIPNHKNNHKPKILHSKSLAVIAVVLILLKVSVTGYLFFTHPNNARMSEIITQRVFELINQDRVSNNLSPLKLNSALSAGAKAKAQDMVTDDYFAHHSPDGKKPWDWINRNNYAYLFVGENLAMNFSSANSAHSALMKSPSHKKNILNERYKDVGLAVVDGKIGGKETKILVQLFATRKEIQVPEKIEIEEKIEEELISEIENKEIIDQPEIKTDVLGVEKEVNSQTVDSSINDKNEVPEVIEEVLPETVKEIKEEKTIESEKIALQTSKKEDIVVKTPNTLKEIKEEVEDQDKMIFPEDVVDIKDETEITEKENQEKTPTSSVSIIANIESPNMELEFTPNKEVTYFSSEEIKEFNFATFLIKASKYIYILVLGIMIIIFALNIFIKITVQHKPVIIQTILLLILISGLISINFHFMEDILNGIAII